MQNYQRSFHPPPRDYQQDDYLDPYGLDNEDSIKNRWKQNQGRGAGRVGQNPNNFPPFKKNFIGPESKPECCIQNVENSRFLRENEIKIRNEQNLPLPMPFETWESTQFPKQMQEIINRLKFKKPTIIQAIIFPLILSGYDVIGIAQTGSGKTFAYLLPGLIQLVSQSVPKSKYGGPQMLILAPTRELAMQIDEQVGLFAKMLQLRQACIYGGDKNKSKQFSQLRDKPQIIIATPGRLMDFLRQNTTTLIDVTYLVIDEADRLLDMGFEDQVREIVQQIRMDRQTVFFSATWPKAVRNLANDFCQQCPVYIQVGQSNLTINKNIEQEILFLFKDEKLGTLFNILDTLKITDKVLIFAETKMSCEQLSVQMTREGYYAVALHGDKTQTQRDEVLQEFKRGDTKLLCATDLASRGLDLQDITVVINYDFPKQFDDYIHRIGRTGRAERKGRAFSFITYQKDDTRIAIDLEKLIGLVNVNINQDDFMLFKRGQYPNQQGRKLRDMRMNKQQHNFQGHPSQDQINKLFLPQNFYDDQQRNQNIRNPQNNNPREEQFYQSRNQDRNGQYGQQRPNQQRYPDNQNQGNTRGNYQDDRRPDQRQSDQRQPGYYRDNQVSTQQEFGRPQNQERGGYTDIRSQDNNGRNFRQGNQRPDNEGYGGYQQRNQDQNNNYQQRQTDGYQRTNDGYPQRPQFQRDGQQRFQNDGYQQRGQQQRFQGEQPHQNRNFDRPNNDYNRGQNNNSGYRPNNDRNFGNNNDRNFGNNNDRNFGNNNDRNFGRENNRRNFEPEDNNQSNAPRNFQREDNNQSNPRENNSRNFQDNNDRNQGMRNPPNERQIAGDQSVKPHDYWSKNQQQQQQYFEKDDKFQMNNNQFTPKGDDDRTQPNRSYNSQNQNQQETQQNISGQPARFNDRQQSQNTDVPQNPYNFQRDNQVQQEQPRNSSNNLIPDNSSQRFVQNGNNQQLSQASTQGYQKPQQDDQLSQGSNQRNQNNESNLSGNSGSRNQESSFPDQSRNRNVRNEFEQNQQRIQDSKRSSESSNNMRRPRQDDNQEIQNTKPEQTESYNFNYQPELYQSQNTQQDENNFIKKNFEDDQVPNRNREQQQQRNFNREEQQQTNFNREEQQQRNYAPQNDSQQMYGQQYFRQKDDNGNSGQYCNQQPQQQFQQQFNNVQDRQNQNNNFRQQEQLNEEQFYNNRQQVQRFTQQNDAIQPQQFQQRDPRQNQVNEREEQNYFQRNERIEDEQPMEFQCDFTKFASEVEQKGFQVQREQKQNLGELTQNSRKNSKDNQEQEEKVDSQINY